jgi:hypothetical protein
MESCAFLFDMIIYTNYSKPKQSVFNDILYLGERVDTLHVYVNALPHLDIDY